MRKSSYLHFLFLGFFLMIFVHCFAQKKDLAVSILIELAQSQWDASLPSLALETINQAEEVFLKNYSKEGDDWVKILCLKGLCNMKKDTVKTRECLVRGMEESSSVNTETQAHVKYLEAVVLHKIEKNYPKAYLEYKKALDLYQKAVPAGSLLHQNAARCYSNLGAMLISPMTYREAMEYFDQSEQIFTAHFGKEHPSTAHPIGNRGLLLWDIGKHDKALKALDQAYQIREKTLSLDHEELGITCNNIGLVWTEKGRFNEADYWFQKAYDIGKVSKNDELTASSLGNHALVLSKKRDFYGSIALYQKVLFLEKKIQAPVQNQSTTLLNIGIGFKDLFSENKISKWRDSSLFYLNEAKKYSQNIEFSKQDRLLSAYGIVYFIDENLPHAYHFFQQTLQWQTKYLGIKNPDVAITWFNFANTALAEKNWEKAFAYNDSALVALNCAGKADGTDLEMTISTFHLSQILAQRAEICWKQPSIQKQPLPLKRLLKICQNTLHAVHLTRSSMQETNDKLLLKTVQNRVSEIAIEANLYLAAFPGNGHFKKDAFDVVENERAQILLEAIRDLKEIRIAGIEPQILERFFELRAQIASIEVQLQVSAFDASMDSVAQSLRSQRQALRQTHDSLQFVFLQKTQRTPTKITVESLQASPKWLQTQQTLLEFFVGDSTIFLFVINRDSFHVQKIARDFLLESWVEDLTRRGFNLPPELQPPNFITHFTEIGQKLYQKLLLPVESLFTDELIIVPDGALSYLPFETLLTAPPKVAGRLGGYPFLIKKHRISYCYSATLLREMSEKNTSTAAPTSSLLGMAPFFEGKLDSIFSQLDSSDILGSVGLRDAILSLPKSGWEVATAAKIWQGTALSGAEATVENFKKLAQQFKILHLATHGKADEQQGDYAWLAFFGKDGQFEKIFARDLYAMQIAADLVVLSACETGIGKQQRGEGIISLARAFAFAGAKSLLTSLWQIRDDSTQKLMTEFYRHLKKGDSKSLALQKAKRHLLRSGYENPFFWSGFIGVGNMDALH